MDVPRIPPVPPIRPVDPLDSVDTGTPGTGERPASGSGDLPFGPGQKLVAHVVQVLAEGRAVLEVGGERLLASTPLQVRVGDMLPVMVRGVGAVVELDLEAPPVAFSERAYAMAAVRQALQQAAPSTPLTAAEVDVLAHALERANWGGGPAGLSPRDRLLALVRPMPLGRDAAPLVDALRDRLASGGSFFEAHAARVLEHDGVSTVPADLHGDVRWLLAALGRETETQPHLEMLRQRLIHDVATRQLDVALAHEKDGAVRLDIPLSFGHVDAAAQLTVKDDGPPARGGERPSGRAITLTVAHPDLGPIEAAAHWQPAGAAGDLQVRFAVRDAEAASALDSSTADLSARLLAAGFRHVGVSVVVDPEAGKPASDDGPDEPPPGGSILSALA